MPKPTADTKWSATGTKTEPSSGQKDAGWAVGQKPPAQWLNWWMDAVDQWVKWLQAFESTAHSWTAIQTFAGIVVTWGGSGNGSVDATGTTTAPAVYGKSGAALNMYGLYGLGADRLGAGAAGFGAHGTYGEGGQGAVIGGTGVQGLGGTGNGAGSNGGFGFVGTGGAISGGSNTTGAAGTGGWFTGGTISADANGRVGGDAVKATAGSGQAGYGRAFYADHGGLTLDDGQIIADGASAPHLLGSTSIDGDLSVLNNTTLTGLLSANGGISLAARTTVFGGVGFQNSWGDATGLGSERVSFRKDAFGVVHMEGAMNGGASGSVAFQLPVGSRPAKQQNFIVPDYGTANVKYISIATNGNVVATFASAGNNAPNFDGITFATS